MADDVKRPEPIGYASKTGHGTYFREALTTELRALEWAGRPMWTPLYDEPTVHRLIAEAKAEERERCARICEQSDANGEGPDSWGWHSKDYAKAIRKKGGE